MVHLVNYIRTCSFMFDTRELNDHSVFLEMNNLIQLFNTLNLLKVTNLLTVFSRRPKSFGRFPFKLESVELKKQSSCSVRLINHSHDHVAFKVKTTSPKKYCVRPNVGIVMPKSSCEFTVTMQAQREAPPDMVCKDKFLIQSTVVPVGTTDENLTSSVFAKVDGRYVEENKLKVALITPPNSPVLSPINGTLKHEPTHEAALLKDPSLRRAEMPSPPPKVAKVVEKPKMVNIEERRPIKDGFMDLKFSRNGVDDVLKHTKDAEYEEELKSPSDAVNNEYSEPVKDANFKSKKDVIHEEELSTVNNLELKPTEGIVQEEIKVVKDRSFSPSMHVDSDAIKAARELNLFKDIEEMKLKFNALESKLNEAESTISKLTEERKLGFQERGVLQEELAVLRSKAVVKQVQVGFPLLFVCMVALISIFLGYRLHT